MEEDFYASIKLRTGEEIFARVMADEDNGVLNLMVTNPIKIETYEGKGYKIEPWMKTTTDDMFIISMEDVVTMTENTDVEMIMLYQSYLRKADDFKQRRPSVSRKMGYLANVRDAKELLEKIWRDS
jgi:hypothetical protein